jgi:hypothetical protein
MWMTDWVHPQQVTAPRQLTCSVLQSKGQPFSQNTSKELQLDHSPRLRLTLDSTKHLRAGVCLMSNCTWGCWRMSLQEPSARLARSGPQQMQLLVEILLALGLVLLITICHSDTRGHIFPSLQTPPGHWLCAVSQDTNTTISVSTGNTHKESLALNMIL